MLSLLLSTIIYASPQNGEVFFHGYDYPAIYGKSATPTPRGTFSLKRAYSTHLKMNVLVFYTDSNGAYAIHPNIKSRNYQLDTPTPSDNYLSNGCIGIAPNLFKAMWTSNETITIIIK